MAVIGELVAVVASIEVHRACWLDDDIGLLRTAGEISVIGNVDLPHRVTLLGGITAQHCRFTWRRRKLPGSSPE